MKTKRHVGREHERYAALSASSARKLGVGMARLRAVSAFNLAALQDATPPKRLDTASKTIAQVLGKIKHFFFKLCVQQSMCVCVCLILLLLFLSFSYFLFFFSTRKRF
jgi:hypothetical protein